MQCGMHMHAAIFVYALGKWNYSYFKLPKLVDLFVKHNSNTFVFDRKQFSEITIVREQSNINMFKLFDLPKSRLK